MNSLHFLHRLLLFGLLELVKGRQRAHAPCLERRLNTQERRRPTTIRTVSTLQSSTRLKLPLTLPVPGPPSQLKITWVYNLHCFKAARPCFYKRLYLKTRNSCNQICHKQVSHDRVSISEPFLNKSPTTKSLQPGCSQLSLLKPIFLG